MGWRTNREGLSTLYTDVFYQYEMQPTCGPASPGGCASPYLFCHSTSSSPPSTRLTPQGEAGLRPPVPGQGECGRHLRGAGGTGRLLGVRLRQGQLRPALPPPQSP